MKKTLPALILLIASTAQAKVSAGNASDFGNRLANSANAAVGNQFLSFPLPMNNLLKGKWQLGVDGGYSSVEAGIVSMKGGMASVGYTYAFADKFGVYALAYGNSQKLSGGGREILVHPFSSSVPLDTPEYAEHSNVRGTARLVGAGAALVFDPLVKDENSHSMPLYAGVLYNRFSLDGAAVDYRMLTGTSAGQRGTMDVSGDYSFLLPFFGWQYARNFGPIKIVPNAFFAPPVAKIPQKGTITGTSPTVFTRSGETSGNADFNFFVAAVGTTVMYRPWGLGANIGATIFKMVAGPAMYGAAEKVVQLDLSWKWGNYAK